MQTSKRFYEKKEPGARLLKGADLVEGHDSLGSR